MQITRQVNIISDGPIFVFYPTSFTSILQFISTRFSISVNTHLTKQTSLLIWFLKLREMDKGSRGTWNGEMAHWQKALAIRPDLIVEYLYLFAELRTRDILLCIPVRCGVI